MVSLHSYKTPTKTVMDCFVCLPLHASLKSKTLNQMLQRFFQNVNRWLPEKQKNYSMASFYKKKSFFFFKWTYKQG